MLVKLIWCGSKIDEACLILGRMSEVYARSLVNDGANLRLLLTKPRVELAFFTI